MDSSTKSPRTKKYTDAIAKANNPAGRFNPHSTIPSPKLTVEQEFALLAQHDSQSAEATRPRRKSRPSASINDYTVAVQSDKDDESVKEIRSPKGAVKKNKESSGTIPRLHQRTPSTLSQVVTPAYEAQEVKQQEVAAIEPRSPVKARSKKASVKMPTPQQQNRRVKGTRITRAFLIGSEAWKLDPKKPLPKNKENHTTGWRVYIRNVEGGPDLTAWLKKVVFVLHNTYENSVRSVEAPPFELEETGYGGFAIGIKLYFQPYASEKQQNRTHFLQLEPYGNEALQAIQRRDNLVRSEYVEHIEFNEPTEQLFDAMTNDNQWDNQTKGRGKGKVTQAPREKRTVELPDNAPEGSVWSKDAEEKFLKILADAIAKVDTETEEILKRTKETSENAAKQIESNEVNAKLLGVFEKLAPPVPATKRK